MASRNTPAELVVLFQDLPSDKLKREENAQKLSRLLVKILKKGVENEYTEAARFIVAETSKLFQSKHKTDILTAIAFTSALAKSESPTLLSDVNLHAFSTCLLEVVSSSDDELVSAATTSIGEVLRRGLGSLTPRFVSNLADRALEWLEHAPAKLESKRLAAATTLQYAATHQPSALQGHIPRVFIHIFTAIKDARVAIREAGVEALRACLAAWRDRQYFAGLYRAIEKALKDNKEDEIHGALLAAAVFVENTGDFVPTTSYYGAICDVTLKFKDRTGPIQNAVVTLMVALARKSLIDFTEYTTPTGPYKTAVLNHVLRLPSRDRDRPFFLVKIRELVECVGMHAEPYAARLIPELLGALKKTKQPEEQPGACDAIAALAHALAENIQAHVAVLVDPLFELGLSEAQARALHALSLHSSRSYSIQRRMLDALSDVLLRHPFTPFGGAAPAKPPALPAPKAAQKGGKKGKEHAEAEKKDSKKDADRQRDARRDAEILLALRILSTFKFTHNVLTVFARDAVLPNFTSENDEIRVQAAETCACIVLPPPSLSPRIDPLLVTSVLGGLVAVAAADRKSLVRRTVLRALAPALDPYLAKAEVVQNLFPCMHDTDDDARAEALKIICRVSKFNPVYTLPALRGMLFQLLSHMRLAGLEDQKKDLELLCIIISHAPRVALPYVDGVLEAILPKVSIDSISVAALRVLEAISVEGGTLVRPHAARVLPLLCSRISDQVCLPRLDAALDALSAFCRAAGRVIKPFRTHPELLESLHRITADIQSPSTTVAALRLLGTLGAIDPSRLAQLEDPAPPPADAAAVAGVPAAPGVPVGVGALVGGQRGSANPEDDSFAVGTDEFYLDTVIKELLEIANNPLLNQLYDRLSRTFVIVAVRARDKLVKYIPKLMPALLAMVRHCEASRRPAIVGDLARIVDRYGAHVQPYIDPLLGACREHWLPVGERRTPPTMHAAVLTLLRAMLRGLDKEIRRGMGDLLEHLLGVFATDSTDDRQPTSQALEALSTVAAFLEDWAAAVVSKVLGVLGEYDEMPTPVRAAAVNTIAAIARAGNLGDQACHVVHALCRTIKFEKELTKECLEALARVAERYSGPLRQLGQVGTLAAVLAETGVTPPGPLLALISGMEVPVPPEERAAPMGPDPSGADPADVGRATQLTMTLCRLLSEGLTPAVEWPEWFRTFTQTLLRESSCPWVCACADLAAAHEPLGKRLFTIALLVAWKDFVPTVLTEASDNIVEIARQHKVFAQLILSTSELMSHALMPLPPLLSDSQLTSLAVSSRAFAKALRSKENEFRRFFSTSNIYSGMSVVKVSATAALGGAIADLIELNQALQVPESARGVLAFAQLHSDQLQQNLPPSWYEKTGEWDKALAAYNAVATSAVDAARTRAQARAREEFERTRRERDQERERDMLQEQRLLEKGFVRRVESERTRSPSKEPRTDQQIERKASATSVTRAGEDEEPLVPEPRAPFDLVLHQLACLDALGRWADMHSIVESTWAEASGSERTTLAPLACAAAAGLGHWASVGTYQSHLPPDHLDGTLYRTMLHIHRGEGDKARELLDVARLAVQPTLAALWSESYSRAYKTVMLVQTLSEMEEILRYPSQSAVEQAATRRTWLRRMKGAQQDSEVFGLLLKARALVLRPSDDMDLSLRYVTICRLSGTSTGLARAHSHLVQLLGFNPKTKPHLQLPGDRPRVAYAYVRLMWAEGRTAEAYTQLTHLIHYMNTHAGAGAGEEANPEETRLLARCYQRLALWHGEAKGLAGDAAVSGQRASWTDADIATVDDCYSQAADLDRDWFKVWQNWANASFLATQHYMANVTDGRAPPQALTHAITSVRAYFNAISLSKKREANIRDTLRLLTLWFTHGAQPELLESVKDGLNTVTVDTWLQVIPQLIARINLDDLPVRTALHSLLVRLGIIHPQALLFPLIVAARNVKAGDAHRKAAQNILQQLRVHSRELQDQAEMVADELIRVALLWSEMWSEGLEEASKSFSEGDYDTMMTILAPLHEKMEELLKAAEYTEREKEFVELFGKELQDAWGHCQRFRRGGPRQCITSAWDIYYSMYRRITKLLSQISMLDLREVSLKLATAKALKLVVPGTYRRTPQPVFIHSVEQLLVVINSKQRPRRFTVRGSDGKVYEYLLKAREDLRQDERVMQLFSLVNTLLAGDRDLEFRHCAITTYYVLPLSPKLGLIQWLPTCDTMHSLVRAHRDRIDKPLNLEVRLMAQFYPDYENLTLIQNVEVFQHALESTPGDDLAQVLWHQSGDAEAWLERRLCYTRSVAVMSMVGHILGLGDRHPSNLMLDRRTGAVIHVDFGDCFEIAMKRVKFPERVPFRLTRMMVAAMEVTGIEGNFRLTCTRMLELLRRNRDSVLSVLEAFVHDPLIDWFARRKKDTMGFEATITTPGTHTGRTPPQPRPRHDDHREGGEQPNQQALEVLTRVRAKLTGRDFNDQDAAMGADAEPLAVPAHVDRLISEARSQFLLCQHFTGWCPFW
eukprot:m.68925 g.68925  ORF g.68925 m.68925 type:complete len:2501 (+) comp12804_c0_seq1:29-7531(+)